jgi:Flavin reductase like domain
VTAVDVEGMPCGLTTTAVTSVSIDPPLILICVGWESRTLPAIRHSGRFAVNFVRASSAALAAPFASKARGQVRWRSLASGPARDTDSGRRRCRLDLVLISDVELGDSLDHEPHGTLPLSYFRRSYGTWASGLIGEPTSETSPASRPRR